jgi:hypothetical protein
MSSNRSEKRLLQAFESGTGRGNSEKAIAILSCLMPDHDREELKRLTVGRRDIMLMALRIETFGDLADATTACKGCGALLEVRLDLRALMKDLYSRLKTAEDGAKMIDGSGLIEEGGYRVSFRLPDSTDLAAIEGEQDEHQATSLLVRRCVLEASDGSGSFDVASLSSEIIDKVEERMMAFDPGGMVDFEIMCEVCGRCGIVSFDILPFFWSEIASWASRMFQEVHALATAYGWSEAEILAMSPFRRQQYLDLVGAV